MEDMVMSKALVAYFSASGATKKLAEKIAKVSAADLFEIVPEKAYTKEDLNWQDQNSRSSVEMNDRASRPAIGSKVDNMAEYDVVFVGFPVWWYREPSIIDTFMEGYDFSGKTVVPFATSGSSDIGDSGKNMQELCKGAKVEKGKRFQTSAPEADIREFVGKYI